MWWSVILWISWIFLVLVSQWDSSRLHWLIHCAWTISGSIVQMWEDMKESRYLTCIQFLTVANVGLGQIYGFHVKLWAEHLGLLEDLFNDWELLECVLSEWDGPSKLGAIFAEEVTNMKGHLMSHAISIKVIRNGCIESLPGHKTFPDVGGNILGSSQYSMPDGLAT